jgi:hypothetical protein
MIHLSHWELGIGGYLTVSALLTFRVQSAAYLLLARHPHSLCRLHANARTLMERVMGRAAEFSETATSDGWLKMVATSVVLLIVAAVMLVCCGVTIALFTLRNLLWWGQRAWWWAPERCRHCPGNQDRRRTRQLARLLPAATGWPR